MILISDYAIAFLKRDFTMNINKLSLIMAITCLVPQIALAGISKNVCIKSIDEVIRHLPPRDGHIIGIFDWDQTVSEHEGGYSPREGGSKGTLATIGTVHRDDIKTIILTARGAGLDQWEGEISPIIKPMLETLSSVKWLDNGALKTENYTHLLIKGRWHLLTKKQIVFAGGGVKGEAIAELIDKGMFKSRPDSIIFVDNDIHNIGNVRRVFERRPENMYLFHYPNPAGGDRPCLGE